MIETDVVLQAVSRGNLDMKRSVVAALGAALIAVLGANSPAQAAAINFIFVTIDGSPDYTGTSLDQSNELNLDSSILLVSEAGGSKDDSGLTPGSTVKFSPMDIEYGFGTGTLDIPILNGTIIKSWTATDGDEFTEKLTTVDSINRNTSNQIIVTLSGMVSDTSLNFVDTPIFLVVNATQFGGVGAPTSAMFTETTTLAVIPEASTWSMMGLGFAALGYAASRRRSAKAAIRSA
jgi:hypothetical protein